MFRDYKEALINIGDNIEKGETQFLIYKYMKAKEVMEKYNITRRTLCNWVKKGKIQYEKTPTGRYIYKIKENNEAV